MKRVKTWIGAAALVGAVTWTVVAEAQFSDIIRDAVQDWLQPRVAEREPEKRPVEVSPILVPAKARTYRDLDATHLAWCERTWGKVFRERSEGQPWQDAARAFVS